MAARMRLLLFAVGMISLLVLSFVGNQRFYFWSDTIVHPKYMTVSRKYDVTNLSALATKVDHNRDTQLQTYPVLDFRDYRKYIPQAKVTAVDCRLLSHGDTSQYAKAENYHRLHPKRIRPDGDYISMAADCEHFIASRKYTMFPVTKEEAEFPLAFGLVVYKDVEQVERLLRAIYRPQNYYCIHLDIKASGETRAALESIAECFDNVFLTSRSIDVQWGWYSVLEPELLCMEELWRFKKWKYFINLTGQEFPLHTNGDIVKVIKALNGSNAIEGVVKERNTERTDFINFGHNPTNIRKSPPPIDVTLVKGAVHVVAQRGFVDFILHDAGALAFREWLNDTGHPDETLFNSINYSPNLKAPGAYLGDPESIKMVGDYPKSGNLYFHRFKNWGDWPCYGQYVRSVCVFGVWDLPLLVTRKELYANKFYIDFDPLLYDCMEDILYNKTRDEFLGEHFFDVSFYANLDQVKNHVHDTRWLQR